MEIYEIPESVHELFKDVEENFEMSYRIINYEDGMDMDNNQSMTHFLECVGIEADWIEEDLGTQVTIAHPDYSKRVVIDAGGLGDFFSHGYDCHWHEEDIKWIEY